MTVLKSWAVLFVTAALALSGERPQRGVCCASEIWANPKAAYTYYWYSARQAELIRAEQERPRCLWLEGRRRDYTEITTGPHPSGVFGDYRLVIRVGRK